MFKKFTVCTLVLLILLGTLSCKRDHYKVDVSDIDLSVNVKRLELDLFEGSPNELISKVPQLKEKYDGFLQLFSFVINIGLVTDSSWTDGLVKFCTDKQNYEVYSATAKLYPDMINIEKGLTDAFKHFRYYFKKRTIPAVFTCISGFNNSMITGDSLLGISLDRYLGSDCKYYPGLNIYKYQAARMNPRNIVPDCMYAWASREWLYKDLQYSADNVLSEMIHEGKLLYFVRCMLPDSGNDLIFGFNTDQMNFCIKNEGQMWQYLIENKLLFSSEQLVRRKLTGEAPFTAYFSKESPGRAAVWTGFRIIESFMAKNKDVTLEELMMMTDCQQILERAKYNPR
jgi:hypothetical protein